MANEKIRLLSAEYENEASLWLVGIRGLRQSPFVAVEETVLETLPGPEAIGSELAWVTFYKRVVARIRHDDILNGTVEVLYGDRKQVGPDHFVVGLEADNYLFKTQDEILADGELSPHMRAWLDRIVENPHMGSSVYWDFADLYGGPLV